MAAPPLPHHHPDALTDAHPQPHLPLDVLRLIFEESLRIYSPSAQGDAARQAAGYTLALVSRTTAAWTAPLLYARVVLVRRAQAAAFARTLRAGGGKDAKGLAGWVRVLWVLVDLVGGQGGDEDKDEENLHTELNEVIRICSNLTSLVCLGHASLILLPRPPSVTSTASSSLHTLTLIAPTPTAAHALPLLHLHTLRIIHASAAFYHAWNYALYASLSASASGLSISEIHLEMLFVPSTTLLLWLVTGTLPGLALCPRVARVRVHARWVFPSDCPRRGEHGDGDAYEERREEYCTLDNWSRCFVFYSSSAKSIVRSSIAQPSQAELARIRGTSAVEAAMEVVAQHDYE